MSDSRSQRVNVGAYDQPFSGVGREFEPLGIPPGRTGLTLHEAGYVAENANWNFPAVFSPFWRLYYNSRRGHCVLFGEEMTELTPAHLVLIPPHCLFHCLGGNPVPHFWTAFSFVKRLRRETPLPVQLVPRDTELCLIRDLIELDSALPDGGSSEGIYRHSLALLQVVLARPELEWQPPQPEGLRRARDLIERSLGQPLPSPQLARAAGMSVAGFNRAFRRHYGTSPARHVAEMRVREAARLLLQSDCTIDNIAEQTGFPNRAYLSRVFKRLTGFAPGGFRRRHRRERG